MAGGVVAEGGRHRYAGLDRLSLIVEVQPVPQANGLWAADLQGWGRTSAPSWAIAVVEAGVTYVHLASRPACAPALEETRVGRRAYLKPFE